MFALAAASARRVERVPVWAGGARVGSVARVHLPLLAGQPGLQLAPDAVHWRVEGAALDALLAALNARLREAGHIRAWRDEPFAVPDPATGAVLAVIERAASRFWGTLTLGAHATGYVAGADGRPAALWIAQRSGSKATDPGLYDNLIGGGVPHGQTPAEALLREGWEEAGLPADLLRTARPAGVLRLHRDIPEGLQHEWLHSWDLALPPGTVPDNQDGEVAGFTLMPVADALALAAGERMTVDAALVTLDFGVRHGLVDDADVARRVEALRVSPPAVQPG